MEIKKQNKNSCIQTHTLNINITNMISYDSGSSFGCNFMPIDAWQTYTLLFVI